MIHDYINNFASDCFIIRSKIFLPFPPCTAHKHLPQLLCISVDNRCLFLSSNHHYQSTFHHQIKLSEHLSVISKFLRIVSKKWCNIIWDNEQGKAHPFIRQSIFNSSYPTMRVAVKRVTNRKLIIITQPPAIPTTQTWRDDVLQNVTEQMGFIF